MRGSARLLVGVVLTGTVALLGLTGCGRLGASSADTTDVTWDGQALQAIGYTTEDVAPAATDPQPTGGQAQPGQRARHPRLRYAFRNTLHAEAVVKTDEGTKTVVAQRGTVTAVDATSVTVKSSDGFTLTWKIADSTKVIVNRAKADLSAITVGTEIGAAGAKDGDAPTARLLVVPKK
jgi:ABC-type transport system substrate-binding protein